MIGKIAYLVGLKITSGFNRGNVGMDITPGLQICFSQEGGFGK